MAIQNDNTLVTKGDLKALYADKIAPYLGGGISYYHTDRTGEELKSCYASLDSNWPTSLANVPMIKRSGTIVQPSVGLFTIPAGSTVEIIYSHSASSPSGDFVMGIYNNTDSVWITNRDGTNGLKDFCPYHVASGSNTYCMGDSYTIQWTNDTGHNVDISLRVNANSIPGSIREDYASLSIKEIGRIVDPVKYVSNNSDLQETPVGNIISYMGNSVPKHYLACDGTVYNIGSYPELEAFIIEEFGSINYFGGDGSTTWAVPDLRGEFLRGTGTNSHEKQGSGAAVGVHQDGTEHSNGYQYGNTQGFYLYGNTGTYNARTIKEDSVTKDETHYSSVNCSKSPQTGGAAAFTSRPTNTSVKYCIKYESTFHAFFSNAAYKVEASFGLTYNSSIQSYTSYSMVYIAGDTSMMDANHFVAPMDGWYSVSFKSSQLDYTKPTIQYIQINDVTSNAFVDGTGSGTSHSHFGINMTQTLYLNKGDKVNYRVWTNGNTISLPAVRSASFCLLTSNYKENIIAGGEVYSTDEQEIGTWTDGKKLYQKTIAVTSQPTINTWGSGYEIGASVDTIVKVTGRLVLDNNAGTYIGNTTWPITTDDDYINYIGTDNRHPSLPNRVGVKVGKQGYTSRPVTITVQYTKTTDTANQYTYKNSLLLTRPDLWDVGVEYDFGGGLYGKRIMDSSIDVASGNTIQPSIAASGVTAIIGYGGMYGNSSSAMAGFGAPIVIRTTSTIAAESAPQIGGTGGLAARICNIAWTTNINKYDVWVTYRKA